MTNVLVKKTLLLAFMLAMMGLANAQSITYSPVFDLSFGATFSDNQSVATEETSPLDLTFSIDGMKVYIIGGESDEINQYALTSAFDISGGLTHEGTLVVGTEDSQPYALTFNADGSKVYMLGFSTDRIFQYSLSSNFDITSTVTLEGFSSIRFGNPNSLAFSNDGTRVFVGSSAAGHIIRQVDLATPYDITSTLTDAGSSEALANSVYDFEFAEDGNRIFILGSNDAIKVFDLETAYDITSTLTQFGEEFAVNAQEQNTWGMAFSPFGDKFFVIGTSGDDINQYDLSGSLKYTESIINDGSLDGEFSSFGLQGETFTNVGGALTYNTDYTISNLPTGLTPALNVSSSGTFATLSFTGQAANNQNTDDVSLVFTFNNTAFTGGDASAVTDAVAANTGITLDFRNNSTPTLSYGLLPNLGGSTANAITLDISSESGNVGDLVFNNDGTKLFTVEYSNDNIYEYTLTAPFDISGASYSGNSYHVGAEENFPAGMTFSSDGSKMFVVGVTGGAVVQYDLSTPFDITSTITHDGSYSLASETTSPQGISFSPDGSIMLISGLDLYTYHLSSPFDVTSTVTFLETYDQSQTIHSAVWGPDGTQILYINSSDVMGVYDLEIPYSLSSVASSSTASVTSQDLAGVGVTYSPDRKKIFVSGSGNDQIYQFTISPEKFEESFNDNGSIIGSIQLRVIDDQFNNANATLTQGIHYSVSGLPAGLSSSLAVASNGLTADLTITGTATDNLPANDVSNLVFTFNNSAFSNSNAADVISAVGADSYFSIDFKDLDGQVFSSDAYTVSAMTFDNNPISVAAQTGTPYGIIFNNDGTRMYLGDGAASTIIQYALSTPYDVSTATVEGTPLDISTHETLPSGIAFNDDGTKMYMIGIIQDKLHQFSLGTPFDINGTVTHEGDIAFTNGIGVTFSSEGSRMFLTSSSLVYQYALSTPYDITAGASQVGSAFTGSANSYSPRFSPDGKEFFVMGGTHRVIYRYSLSNAFDITDGITSSGSLSVGGQDTSPLSMTFSGDGRTVYMTGGVGDDINVYELPGIGFTEVSTNSGAMEGTYELNLIGDTFVNANGNLSPGTHYTATGLPAGLSSTMSVSADGGTATFSITGNATDHQDINDATIDLNISLLNAAFTGGDASSVGNNSFNISANLDFDDNGSLSYSGGNFYEDFSNDGSIVGSLVVTITGETFSSTGLLTNGVDYSIIDIPSGLTPELLVAGNRLSATLTLSGNADNHQNSDGVSDLEITFENSAFTSSDAQYVFNAIGASTGSTIGFDDNTPSITYGNKFDLSGEDPLLTTTFDVSDLDNSPGAMAFNNDGLKMFYVGYENDMIFEYHLTNPFDVSSGVTYSGNSYDISSESSSPSDLIFNPDGTTMFLTDGGSDEVEQYSLSNAFDLSSTITHQGAYDLSNEDIQPAGITFSKNGRKMYMVGSANDKIFQYTLTTPYHVITGVSYDNVEATVPGRNWTDIDISADGKQIYVLNSAFPGASYITQYDLNTPYLLQSGIAQTGSFYFQDLDNGPTDFEVSPDRKILMVLGAHNDQIYQFDLETDGFYEIGSNNGEVTGSLYLEINDELFTSVGGTFTYETEYTINNLPTGLVPSLAIAADGESATLSLSGAAADHQNINDVSLEFTFNNSAFVGGNSSAVANATAIDSEREVNFRDNNPGLNYGNPLDMDFATTAGSPLDVSSYSDYTSGIAFSNDGMKMFISVYGLSTVYEYALSNPYDLTGATETASYNHSAEDTDAEELAFSADGMKMFVLGAGNYSVYQYNLTTPFDISSGVSYSGLSFDHQSYDLSVYALAFSPDGSKMYLGSGNENAILQFTLGSTFDLSSVSYDGNPLDIGSASPTGMVFSSDGRYVLMTEDNTYQTIRYRLYVPYDVTQGGVAEETFDLDALSIWPTAIGSSPDGSRVLISDGDNYDIYQYSIDLGDFTETGANDGTVEGSTNIYLTDDEFTNKGGTLSYGSDYSIANLPAGLTPTFTVAADGFSGVLSMPGTASDHGDTEDIAGLEFTFANSAFENYPASEVTNSTNHTSNIGINFSPYTENDIISFAFTEISGSESIDAGAHTVVAEAVAGTDISSITPTLGISQNAEISPNTDTEQDFTSPITYMVTAEDGTPQDWEVTVTEEISAPTDILLSSTSVDERSSPGTIVGELSAIDANFIEDHNFYVVAELESDDWQSFAISYPEFGGVNLVTTDFISLDFETKSSFTFNISVQDADGEVFEKEFTVTLNDVNEDPTDITLDSNSIDESNPIGTLVGFFSTVDEDLGQSHAYSLVEGVGSDDNLSFTISGSDLLSAEEFDFETKTSYSVRVQTSDGLGGTFEEAFIIAINDLPAQITSIELDNSTVNENEAVGTVVGAFSTFGEDLSGSFTYTLEAGVGDDENASFTISGDQLLIAESFNFEGKSSYSILVMSDDGDQTELQQFSILVNDLNDTPTDIALDINAIAENNSVGDAIGSFTSTDEDTGESFTYSLVSGTGDTDNASFSIVGNELQALEVFDFETQSSYTVRVETNDGNGGTFQKSFTVTITNENETILVANPIVDLDLDEKFTSTEIDLSNVFEDQDGDALTYQASSSNTGVVTVNTSGATLTITEVGDFGSSTITVTADDGSGVTTSDEFVVTVSNVNDAPVVANAIADQSEDEGFGILELDLASTFTDEDGDNLSFSASSSDAAIATVSISATTLTISEVGNGTSTITLTADDGNGGTGTDEFILTVNNVNDAPVVANAISDQDLNEGFGSLELDLTEAFTDEDDDNLTLSASSSEETVATVSLSGTTLTISEIGIGTTIISVVANDGNGGTISDNFAVTVNNVNDAPVVVNAIADQTEEEGFGSIDIDLANTFSDADGDALTLSVVSNDETVVTATISGTTLTLTEAGIGTSSITITANDGNGGSVSDTFIVTVNEAPNNAPVVVNPLDDETSLVEGFNNLLVSYSDVFEDADGDALTVFAGSSDETVVTVDVVSNNQIQINEVGIGTATITLTADDGNGGSVSDTFIVTVNEAPNNAPVVVNPLDDETSLVEGFNNLLISYSDVFEDADGDALSISVSSSDETIVTVEVISNNQIQINEVGIGTATITLTADDGNGGSVSDAFIVTVNEALSNETDIIAFSEPTQTAPAVIDSENHTISITLQPTSDVITYDPVIEVSEGATYELVTALDFSEALIYKVTAEDGTTTQDWMVSVTFETNANGLAEEVELQFYPNPATDYLLIRARESISVEVLSLNGVKVKQPVTGSNMMIDLSTLSSGNYLLRIWRDGNSDTQRFIKIN